MGLRIIDQEVNRIKTQIRIHLYAEAVKAWPWITGEKGYFYTADETSSAILMEYSNYGRSIRRVHNTPEVKSEFMLRKVGPIREKMTW